MPGRKYDAGNKYRYGFNGKENDNEIKGEGNQQDYGLRIYDPKLGKFLSVDPLIHSYPFYSPYHFAGNSPIKFIDLDGGEPKAANSTNPEVKKMGGDAKFRLWAIHGAYGGTGGDKAYFAHSETETKGNYVPVENTKFLSNGKQNNGVNTNTQFLLSNEKDFSSQKDLVNTLLGDFIWGNGPENIVFPHNGKFSKGLSSSIMVGETLAAWNANRSKSDFTWTMDKRGEINVDVNSGFTSLEHFIGSAALNITTQKDNTVLVEIFNVTSLKSGDINKDLPFIGALYKPLESTKRNSTNSSQVEYSNQSQYFSFTLTQNEAAKIIKQYKPAGNAKEKKK